MNIPQIYHLEGDVWLVPCMANYNQNEFHPLLKPASEDSEEDPSAKKQGWNDLEDQMLLRIVEAKGPKAWSAIAREINSLLYSGKGVRQGRQCRERWYNHVDPSLKKGHWSPEEDIYILQQQRDIGNRWSEIAKGLPGRTENSVKNRWKSMVKKAIREYPPGTDIISMLISEKINCDVDMEEDSSDVNTEKEVEQAPGHVYDIGSSPPSGFQQPHSLIINSVRTNLSNFARMDFQIQQNSEFK
ncbi:unnamed protein product [Blepharisma stoltei]|uniref:Myb-like DNA-binding domain containing protein n=1 Tax=Blepharisma stoltei TaxID=1481888 RepID=A0AAU9JED9_9CILI|nr:unnamed protein product [Blepharisma stoltei]